MTAFNRISNLIDRGDFFTHDPYDLWKTKLGLASKRLYFKNKIVGLLPVASLTLFDLFINNHLRLGYKKQDYPIVRAQLGLSCINLFKDKTSDKYLAKAIEHADWLLENYNTNFKGWSWGTGFEIVISPTLTYSRDTPFTTNIPYVVELFYELFEITQNTVYKSAIQKVFEFYEMEIVDVFCDETRLATSYGPFKDRVVTNSVSYTLYMYSLFIEVLELDKNIYENKIKKMYNFIISVQREDGSWLYGPFDSNSFIDCFHSAFILKNLIKSAKHFPFIMPTKHVEIGYKYIKDNFYDDNYKLFKRFSIKNKPSLIKFDLYDNAEMLYLAKLMGDEDLVQQLLNGIELFYKNESLYSTIDIFGSRKNADMLRWASVPYLQALTYNV
ncbi:hypothetical protein KO525_07385 [Psychrosphaera sp. B3R10]|uniref:hypothetical protein n=1 Tax=unclassified Psychrosphaera TaxID=2641570 RepID=UPI001C0A3B7C|nr:MULTISPECIES: hypothetical protein [unclassified Psychrosphaera]MBU2881837.1 hypothetical protein [Psychrosphaera sp. I2R16]MBU2989191.1 hypothetical protein [Psychrosphaera sp. B3R10]MDO6719993.1 hypothetical protein [Psychrosphaera sp. 1_MG-2023]